MLSCNSCFRTHSWCHGLAVDSSIKIYQEAGKVTTNSFKDFNFWHYPENLKDRFRLQKINVQLMDDVLEFSRILWRSTVMINFAYDFFNVVKYDSLLMESKTTSCSRWAIQWIACVQGNCFLSRFATPFFPTKLFVPSEANPFSFFFKYSKSSQLSRSVFSRSAFRFAAFDLVAFVILFNPQSWLVGCHALCECKQSYAAFGFGLSIHLPRLICMVFQQ